MVGMVGDAELLADDVGDTGTGPDVATEAIGCGSLRQKRWYLCSLCSRQSGWCSGLRPMAKGLNATRPGPFEPLTHGAFGHTKSNGNVSLPPAHLGQLPGPEATTFLPVMCCFC
jgi:hypothetical protein